MFNFKNFLELNKYHKNWKKLFNDTIKNNLNIILKEKRKIIKIVC